jgi:ADP-heptose:LPS heptosyltransferase
VHKGLRGWITHPCPIHHPQPYPAYFRDMVKHLAGESFPEDLRPHVYPQNAHREMARQVLAKSQLNPGTFSVMFISSRQPSGVCPTATMIVCMKQLIEVMPMPIVLAGAKSDEHALHEAARHLPVIDVWAGSLPLLVLVECLRRARFVFTTDSGPRHLANAAGAPVVFPRNLFFTPEEAGRYLSSEFDLMPATMGEVEPGTGQHHFKILETTACRDQILEFLGSHAGRQDQPRIEL